MLLHASISWLFFSGRAAWLPHPYFYHPVPHVWCAPPQQIKSCSISLGGLQALSPRAGGFGWLWRVSCSRDPMAVRVLVLREILQMDVSC